MSDVFSDLFRRFESVESVIDISDVIKAQNELSSEIDNLVSSSLKCMIKDFIVKVADLRDEVTEKREALESASSELSDLESSLEYFGQTGNPLPFLRVAGEVERGRVWCVENGLRVIPDIQDRSSEWYIQGS